jgi:hypothetical protein
MCKRYVNDQLYDDTEIDANFIKHADDSRIWVNNVLGRTANFDAANLVIVQYEPIVQAASQYTAAQFKKEARGGCIDDEGIDVWTRDVGVAEKTLLTWMENNPTLAAAQTMPQVAPSVGVERIDVDVPGDLKFDQPDILSFDSVLD